jgi:hypothetical protein
MLTADHPWKEVCQRMLRLVLALLLPSLHRLLDGNSDYSS